jgi:lipoic acid synthetase
MSTQRIEITSGKIVGKGCGGKPKWLKTRPPSGEEYLHINQLTKKLNLATVCQSAKCPNMAECWQAGTATIMIMGDVCTRNCRFCAVKTGDPNGWLDHEEPQKVAKAISEMGLSYVVLTSVDRDDLEDLGADHFAQTIRALKEAKGDILVEVLTPDFCGREELIAEVIGATPDVFAHNIETVRRLTPKARDRRATYENSLKVLRVAKEVNPNQLTKSAIMLGIGERETEVEESMQDLLKVGCDFLTLGQYLQPTPRSLRVKEFVAPKVFDEWKAKALKMGFKAVASGPMVRSSYKAAEMFSAVQGQ